MGKHRTALFFAAAILISVPTVADAQLVDVLGVEVDVGVDLGDGIDLDASVDVGGGDDAVLGVGAAVEFGGNGEGGVGGGIDGVLDSILGPAGGSDGLGAQLDTLIALGGPGGGGVNTEIDALMALGGEPGSSIGGLDLDSIFNLVFSNGGGGAHGGVSGNARLGAGGGTVNPNTGIDLDINLLTLGGVDNGGGNPGGPGTPGGPAAPPSMPPMVFGGSGGGGASAGGPAVPSSLLTLWASLNPAQQQRLVGQCLTILGHPRDYRRDWVDLCRHVGVLPGVQQVFVAVR